MTTPASSPDDGASRAWSSMRAFVTANDRRDAVQAALKLGRGFGRVTTLLLLDEGAKTLSEIAEMTGVDAPYATVVVDKLEERGWVVRVAHPNDHRRKLVRLTTSGRRACALAVAILAEPPVEVSALTPRDLRALERVMTALQRRASRDVRTSVTSRRA